MTTQERIEMHARLYKLFMNTFSFAELLRAAGNFEGANLVEQEARSVAKHGDLSKILHGGCDGQA